ncbi:MAG: TfoX/Sxy family protein [Candidatus Dormibacteraeota bacterium]|nr:TfoX/Sxy family protein [Candidatus Dormibacteraeota bacterium]
MPPGPEETADARTGASALAAEERFARVVEALADRPGVVDAATEPLARRRFGGSGLKLGRRLFAMPVRGRLVVKLPRGRVDELVAAGAGERYDPRRDGRLMKEWLHLSPMSGEDWLGLATEALEFATAQKDK